MNKVLNYTFSDGLIVTSVKLKKGTPLAICYVTDLEDTTRIVLDLEGKRLVSTQIQVKESDITGLIEAIKNCSTND